ncbi:MAG: TetR/AcrR family transcriptional regulator [Chloroflexota bacterium]
MIARSIEAFGGNGYRRMTANDLLKAIGLSKSSLHSTFGSKQPI